MGRLAGFKYAEVVKRLRHFGFVFYRNAAGSHEIWVNHQTNRYTTIPTIPVITKVDKVSRNELARRMARISQITGLSKELFTPFSVLSKQGYEDLWELINLALEPGS